MGCSSRMRQGRNAKKRSLKGISPASGLVSFTKDLFRLADFRISTTFYLFEKIAENMRKDKWIGFFNYLVSS